jgi:hypothetical protein
MKTPIEILFERHRGATAKLDTIRQTVIAGLAQAHDATEMLSESDKSRSGPASFRDFVLSIRWHLAGIGAAWILVALLNLDHSPTTVRDVARASNPPSEELLTAWRENRRQVLELMELPVVEPTPPPNTPQRRGELQATNVNGVA